MNPLSALHLMVTAVSFSSAYAEVPKLASLKAGEQLNVNLTMYGYTITTRVYEFTSEKVTIQANGKNLGEVLLSAEDKVKLDEFLNSLSHGLPRPPGQEGEVYKISFATNQQTHSWEFDVSAGGSSTETFSLSDLEIRLQKLRKEKEFNSPEDGYLRGYQLVGKAEKATDHKESLRLHREALEYFKAIKSRFPDWKTVMVDSRIQQTEEAVARLSATK